MPYLLDTNHCFRLIARDERMFAALRDERTDKASAVMVERCQELAIAPPKDWNGTYHLTTK